MSLPKHMQIPPRWLHCPRKGQIIAETFLPLKTPLDERYDGQVPEENRFNIDMLFLSLKSQKVRLGLIIDLTNTTRFYNKTEVEKRDCKYLKMQCRGHGATPTPDQARTFVEVCSRFIAMHPLEVIGVHCTHGFNRTGFLIISYLVEKMDWSVDAAVGKYAQCRPPGIYKQDYLTEIFSRYGDEMDTPDAPVLPDWCLESDDGDRDDDGNAFDEPQTTDIPPKSRKRKRELNKKEEEDSNHKRAAERSSIMTSVTPSTSLVKLLNVDPRHKNKPKWTHHSLHQPTLMQMATKEHDAKMRLLTLKERVWKLKLKLLEEQVEK